MHIDELLTEAFRLFYYDKQPVLFESCTHESDRDFWMKLYTFVLQNLGAHEAWSEDEIRQYSHELYDIYTAPEHYHLFEDVKESLTRLQQMGLRLGIVSNFAPTLLAVLESKGIAHYSISAITKSMIYGLLGKLASMPFKFSVTITKLAKGFILCASCFSDSIVQECSRKDCIIR
jgi:phosphoglycolate phosphatase-like HAD superfamily hydrolase